MHLKIKIFGLILSVVQICWSLPPCKEVVYDHYQLALTWPNEYCSENYCIRDWDRYWDGKSLIIHGLWPASVDLAYLTCLAQKQYDPYCYETFSFDEFKFSSKQIQQMRKYWPKLSNPRNFWSHEWQKHGTCYLDLIKNKYKSSLTLTEIYKTYFLETINKSKKLNIALTKGQISSQSDLAKVIKVASENFYAICGQDNELDQIRVCYSITQKPGEQKITKCPANRDYNLCKYPIKIK